MEELSRKMDSVSDDLKPLYRINKQCKIFIDANQNLEAYISIYEHLQNMQVDDQILQVKFSKCEDDYDKPLYCPYFETANIVIKNDNDKRFAERYFVEYCTSKNDPDFPFYRKINMFK